MIRLTAGHLEFIGNHGVDTFPHECVGALLGDLHGEVKVVHEVRPLGNTFAPDAEFERSVLSEGERQNPVAEVGQERRYLVSPEEMFQLMQEERRTGRKILGFYHSHPNHPAQPSEYDRVWASPWYTYVIISIHEARPGAITAWRLNGDHTQFEAEEIEEV